MNNNIKCPKCGEVFDVENVIAADIEKKYQQEYKEKLNISLDKIEEDKKKLRKDRKDQYQDRAERKEKK